MSGPGGVEDLAHEIEAVLRAAGGREPIAGSRACRGG